MGDIVQMKKLIIISVCLSLSACGATIPAALTQPCKDWPSAGPGGVKTTQRALELAAEGKLAHADCKARYDALRKATEE